MVPKVSWLELTVNCRPELAKEGVMCRGEIATYRAEFVAALVE